MVPQMINPTVVLSAAERCRSENALFVQASLALQTCIMIFDNYAAFGHHADLRHACLELSKGVRLLADPTTRNHERVRDDATKVITLIKDRIYTRNASCDNHDTGRKDGRQHGLQIGEGKRPKRKQEAAKAKVQTEAAEKQEQSAVTPTPVPDQVGAQCGASPNDC